MAVKSSTNPDAVIFDYFGYTYEIIDENKKEVALKKALKAHGRVIIPHSVEYNGESYIVTAIGTNYVGMRKKTAGIRETDKRKKNYWKEEPKMAVHHYEYVGPFTPVYNIDYEYDETGYNESITSIVLPDSIKKICEAAFRRCSALKEVNLPQGITVIPFQAFSGCKSLESISLPDGITSIGANSFIGCSALKEITIPSSVKTIDNLAFCDSMESKHGLQIVNIMNDEGDVIIHPNAITSGAKINYLGKEKAPKQESGKTKTPKAETKQEEITAPVIDLDKLINAVVADGVVTDKEREVILKKAKTAGYDVDEVEIFLDGKLAEKQAQNTPAPVVDKKKEEKVVSTPKAEPTPKKDASKTKEEVNSVGGRDYTKYSVNGEGSYGKARLVEAVINKYIELNSNITIDKLKEIFPDKLQGTVLIEDSADNIKDMKRFYESALPNGTKFYISNQWGTQIDTFIKHVDCAIDNITITKL